MNQRKWLIACVVQIIASLAGGIAIGFALSGNQHKRGEPTPSLATAAPPMATEETAKRTETNATVQGPKSDGIRIEELGAIEEYFALAELRAVAFKCSDRNIRFWVEAEQNGVTRTVFEPQSPFQMFAPPADAKQEQVIVWIRGPVDNKGRETWSITIQNKVVLLTDSHLLFPADQRKGVQVVKGNQDAKIFSRKTIQLWNDGEISGIKQLPATRIEIPAPLPKDRAICLKEYREERSQNKAAALTSAASAFPLLGGLGGNPFQACAIVLIGNGDPVCVVRLMCMTESEKTK